MATTSTTAGERAQTLPFRVDESDEEYIDIVAKDCRACTYDRMRRHTDKSDGTETFYCNCCGHRHNAEFDYL